MSSYLKDIFSSNHSSAVIFSFKPTSFLKALLYSLVSFSWLYGRIPNVFVVIAVCFLLILSGFNLKTSAHISVTALDTYAQDSRFIFVPPGFKLVCALASIILCLVANSLLTSIFILISATIVTVLLGRIPLSVYLFLMSTPLTFLLLGSLALIYNFSAAPLGYFDLPFFSGYICISDKSQQDSFLVTFNALASISCLYALSLSTPLSDIIGALKRARVPTILIELMYLIYRYIFVLMDTFSRMNLSAHSRLGYYKSWSASLRTMGVICSNLLRRSFQRASAAFDAMEARCYTGTLLFLEHPKTLHTKEILLACVYFIVLISIIIARRFLV